LRQSVLGEQGYGHAANPAAHLRLRHRPHRTSSFASLSLNSNERIPINRGRERNVQVELPMQIRLWAARWNVEARAWVVMASLSLLLQLRILIEVLRHVEVML
jgi:hypothetical protein